MSKAKEFTLTGMEFRAGVLVNLAPYTDGDKDYDFSLVRGMLRDSVENDDAKVEIKITQPAKEGK